MGTLARFAIVSAVLFQCALAQPKGSPVTMPGGVISTLMPIAAYGNVVNGPTVGPDGNAYLVVTTVQPATTAAAATSATQLISVGPAGNGKVNWSLPLTASYISAPAFGASGSGLLFLTTSEPVIMPMAATATTATPVAQKPPALLIISVTPTSAHIAATVNIAANTLSAPQVSPDGQTIYVGQTSPYLTPGTTPGTIATVTAASATLYAYSTTGTLKNSVKLY